MSSSEEYSYSDDSYDVPAMTKKTINKGDGETRPRKGDICTVHYICRDEEDLVFDSTLLRKKPFKFKVPGRDEDYFAKKGVSLVIKGLELGIKRMTLGERAMLTIGPSGAAGSKGLRGRNPMEGNGAAKKFMKRQKVEVLRVKEGVEKWTTAHILAVHPVSEHTHPLPIGAPDGWTTTKEVWLNTYDIKYKEGGGLEDQAYYVKPERIREAVVYPDIHFTMEVELLSINTQYNKYGTFCGYEPEHWSNTCAMIFCCYMPPRPDEQERMEEDPESVTFLTKAQDRCCRPKPFHPLADRPEPDSDDYESFSSSEEDSDDSDSD